MAPQLWTVIYLSPRSPELSGNKEARFLKENGSPLF